MAIKKVIEIDVDQVKAMGGLKAFEAEIKKTEESTLSLKAELRKLKEELASLPEGSERYKEVSQRAGEVSDKIGDINQRIKSLGSDTKIIDGVVQGAQALSGAFSVAQSASALLGDENEDLQKTMAKVEGAIALTVGVQSIANALQKDTALSIGLTTIATKIQTGAQIAYATVVGTTTGALKALRVALLSTGVGALVVGLGLLISAMNDATEETKDQEKALDDLTKAQERYNESLKNEIKAIENSTKIRVLRAKIAGQSEKDLREIEKKGEEERANEYRKEAERLDGLLKNTKLSNKEFALLQKQRDDLSKEILDFAQERELNDLEFKLGLADKQRAKVKENADEAKRIEKEKADELKRLAKETYDLNQKLLGEQNKRELSALDLADEIRLEKENLFRSENENALILAEENYNKKKAIIEQDIVDEQTKKQALLDLETVYFNQVNDIKLKNQAIDYENEKKLAEEKQQLEKNLLDAKLAFAQQGLNLVAEIAGRGSKIGKAVAVAQATISGIEGVQNAYTTAQKSPITVGFPAYPIVQASLAGVFSALQIKKILSTNVGSAGSVASSNVSSGGGGSAPAPPQFNIVGQSSTNQLTSTIAGQQNRPVQTYVVGSQVSSQQSLDRNAIATSTFG